jgi:hypothetical protein
MAQRTQAEQMMLEVLKVVPDSATEVLEARVADHLQQFSEPVTEE